MEVILIIGGIIAGLIFLSFVIWKILELDEQVKFLNHKIEYLEHLQSQEPEQQINIDYQNLNQEL